MDSRSGGDLSQLRDLIVAALELPLESRADFVRQRTVGNAELERDALRLLAAAESGPLDLETPVGKAAERFVAEAFELSSFEQPSAGERVGRYRLLEKIGEGGMGSVYLGERADGSFDRKVAIKFVREGRKSESVLERFATEEQILAGLVHPGIARIYDGGVSDTGVPYFAMEYVEGVRITDYCAENRLTVDQRLRLFLKVCEVVQFAQQNLVVHRDLKPSNILVTRDGQVKLLDFGIAKVIEDGETDATQTRTQVLTPAYAAPEQLTAGRVTTATDVYSLGVVLFEMVTGKLPYERSGSYVEILTSINAGMPRAPSKVVTASSDQRASSKPVDSTHIRRLHRRLKRDIDAVILKALRKEPEKRYPTAESLADDISRSIENLPVEAKRGERWYRVGRFTRRHRVAVLAVVALTLLVSGFLWRLAVEREEAQAQARRAESVSSFLTGLFQSSANEDALRQQAAKWFGSAPGDRVTVETLLQRGGQRLQQAFPDEPEIRQDLLRILSEVQLSRGRLEVADSLARESLRLAEDLYGPSDTITVEALRQLSQVFRDKGQSYREDSVLSIGAQRLANGNAKADFRARFLGSRAWAKRRIGRHADAEQLARQAISLLKDRPTRLLGGLYTGLASIYGRTGEFGKAEEAARKALSILSEIDPDAGSLWGAKFNLAQNLAYVSRYDESADLLEELLPAAVHLYDSLSVERGHTLQTLGAVRSRQGNYAASESLLVESIALFRAYEEPHPSLGASLDLLAQVYRQTGDMERSIGYSREAMNLTVEIQGEQHPESIARMHGFGQALKRTGDVRAAIGFLLKAAQNEKSGRKASMLVHVGHCDFLLGNSALAEQRYREALALTASAEPVDSLLLMNHKMYLPGLMLDGGRLDEAYSVLAELQGYLLSRASEATPEMYLGQAYVDEARLRIKQGKPVDAEELAQRSEEIYRRRTPGHLAMIGSRVAVRAEAVLHQGDASRAETLAELADSLVTANLGENHYQTAVVRGILGETLSRQRRYIEAQQLLVSSYRLLRSALTEKSPLTRRAKERLIELYERWRRPVPDSLQLVVTGQGAQNAILIASRNADRRE